MSEENNEEAPKALTADEVNKMIHAAITKRNKSTEDQFNELKQLITQSKSPVSNEESSEDKKPSRLATVEAELKKMREEDARKEALIKQRDLTDQLKTNLTKVGVLPEFMPAILALFESKKMATYDDAGNMVMPDDNGEYSLNLESGVKNWVNKQGQIYLAAKDIRGTGTKGFNKPKINTDSINTPANITNSDLADMFLNDFE